MVVYERDKNDDIVSPRCHLLCFETNESDTTSPPPKLLTYMNLKEVNDNELIRSWCFNTMNGISLVVG